MEEPKPPYRPWVGVLLSFLISGAGQFLAGRKRRGALWFMAFFILTLVELPVAASPRFSTLLPALFAWVLVVALWLMMLRDAYLPIPRLKARDWVVVPLLAAALAYVEGALCDVFVRNFKVPTNSMFPTIRGAAKSKLPETKDCDQVLVQRYAYWFRNPQRGEIMVFRTVGIADLPQDQFYAFRVVGLPGERISLPNGRLHVDGQPVAEPQVFKEIRYDDPPLAELRVLSSKRGSFVVPPDHYFMLGDNAMNARDSREYGPVPARNIFGRMTKIYWPPSRAGIPRFVPTPAGEAKRP